MAIDDGFFIASPLLSDSQVLDISYLLLFLSLEPKPPMTLYLPFPRLFFSSSHLLLHVLSSIAPTT